MTIFQMCMSAIGFHCFFVFLFFFWYGCVVWRYFVNTYSCIVVVDMRRGIGTFAKGCFGDASTSSNTMHRVTSVGIFSIGQSSSRRQTLVLKTMHKLRAVAQMINAFTCLAYDWMILKMNERSGGMTSYNIWSQNKIKKHLIFH